MQELHRMDTESRVFFYENEFYPLSNFSAFSIIWKGVWFQTSEHAYHWEKFEDENLKRFIQKARSAHDALKLAQSFESQSQRRRDWDDVKLKIMKEILRAKVSQHPYVKKKLLETGDRELIEDSWRDDFWGWGLNKDGQNHMGKLWMQIRKEIEITKTRE